MALWRRRMVGEGGSIPTLVIKRGVVCEKRELDAGRRARRSGTWSEYNLWTRPACHTLSKALATSKKTATVFCLFFEALQNILYYAEDLLRTGVGGAKTELFINDKTFSEEVITETSFKNSLEKFGQTAQEADRSITGREVARLPWFVNTYYLRLFPGGRKVTILKARVKNRDQ
ncbi:hypothetical protein EVAR_3151_1 [Eumeta japonica]|uniref:Uncharacterized protein n=1 Tax=Eumeta variegata TaxID=151549 RepID=A0A4C1XJH7_EUMVA|nr:hypothetical protein EVAR_3151_1 [Eumeta japonica]